MLKRSFNHSDKNLLLQHGSVALLQLTQRRGGQLHKLLNGTRIFEQDLANPLGRCDHCDWLKLISHCQQLHSTELPFLLADSLLQDQQIALCQSLAAANDLAQSLQHLWYFRHHLLPAMSVQTQVLDNQLLLLFKPSIALGAQQAFVISFVISLIVKLIKQQLGDCSTLQIYLQQAAPPFTQQISAHWPCQVQFAQPFDALMIPLAMWHQPFADRDPRLYRQLRQDCYQINQKLPAQRGLLEQLQRLIAKRLPQQLIIDDAAALLGYSCSTLKRLLQQQDTHFAALVDEVRHDKAQLLLWQGKVSNRQLAEALGYSDEHNFRRAFKRWTGMLPSKVKALASSTF